MLRFFLLLLLTSLALAEPQWQPLVQSLDLPALEQLVQQDRAGVQQALRAVLARKPTDWKDEARRRVEANMLARALGQEALEQVKSQGLLWDSPLWQEDPKKACRYLERRAQFDAAIAEADRRFDEGSYAEVRECLDAATQHRPFDDRDANFEFIIRNFIYQECVEWDDYMPEIVTPLRASLGSTDLEGRAVDSVVTAELMLARLARRADRPLEARRLYEQANRHARLANNPITTAARLVARTYLYQDECFRQGYPQPAEFQKQLRAWLVDADPSRISACYRPRLGEAAVTWAELALACGSPQSLAELESELRAWEKAGMRQASFARLRVGLLQGDLEKVAQEYDRLAPDSQEALRFLIQLRTAQARKAAEKGLAGYPEAMMAYQDALGMAEEINLTRYRIDLVNEFTPFLRQMPIYAAFPADNDWALSQSRARGYRKGVLQALIARGDYALEQEQREEALRCYEQALTEFESWVGEVGAGPQQREGLLRPMQRVYQRVADLKLSSGQSQEAFLALVREQQAQRLLTTDPMKVEPLQGALRAQEQAREQQEELSKLQGQQADPARIQQASTLLASTKAEFFSTVRQLRQSGKNYDGMLAIQPVEFAQLQQSLPEGTLLVQYYPADTKLYMFLITRTDFKIRTVEVARADLEEKIKASRRALVQPGRWDAAGPLKTQLEELYALLIAPASEEVGKAGTLAFVPTGQLLYLPFGALVHGDRFLAQEKPLVTLLRAADLARLDRPVEHGKSLLALGNPDGSLSGAEAEVKALGSLFPQSQVFVGSQADRAKLMAPSEFVHLATHALLNPRDPNSSYLVLGSGGKLGVNEIFELPLGKTRLVTLSACQTELGESQPGAALSSLAEAFWVAGTPTMVASLWKVDDQATRTEMVAFYKAIQEGKNMAEAMQAAAMSLIAAPETAHPFYWAAFTVIGDWR